MIGLAELIVLLGILHILLWFIATIRILWSKFAGHYKIIWLLVVLVVPVIGPIAYFAMGKKQKIVAGKVCSGKTMFVMEAQYA